MAPFPRRVRIPDFASGKCAVAPVYPVTRNGVTHNRPLTIPPSTYDHRVWPRTNNAYCFGQYRFYPWADGRKTRHHIVASLKWGWVCLSRSINRFAELY
ncbi:MAG: hypothetical protein ACI88A_005177 [Paraglaciecola sp.]